MWILVLFKLYNYFLNIPTNAQNIYTLTITKFHIKKGQVLNLFNVNFSAF